MKNLKKLLAVIVAICVIATFTVPAFAEDAAIGADAQICKDLGVLTGSGSNGVDGTYLATVTNRFQAALLTLRLMGKEAEALAYTSDDNFTDASNVTWAAGRNVLAFLKANKQYGWWGDGIAFYPTAVATPQMIYKAILTALGYVEGTDFDYAKTVDFAATKGLTKVAALASLTNNDTAIALVEGLKAQMKDGSATLGTKLADANVIDKAKAQAAGVYYTPVALDVASAVAINSKVVEVTLGTAAVAADLTGVTVKDSAGKDVAVSKVEFAPWSTDGKDVLVTLGADTVVGTYYTVTSGTKSANFGGLAVDATAPTVTSVTSSDYNQITVNFSEPIILGGTVTAALKYTPNTALATSAIAYASSSSITLTTDAQTASLYGTAIKGFKDLAGNAMADDTAKTFIGQVKNANPNTIKSVTAIDSKTIEVAYNIAIDATTSIDATKYTAALAYTPKTALEVASVTAKDATTVTVKFKTDTVASLYSLSVATGIATKYGTATTAALTATFIGQVKDVDAIASISAAPVSNTKVNVTLGTDAVKDALDATTAKEMFTIKTKYAPVTDLAISAISITGNVATLTVAAQSGVLYEVTAKTGIKDAAGNATTADLKNTFVGQPIAAKIAAITSIVRKDDTHIKVAFDQNVGSTVTDISHYSIDNSVGYVQKAETSYSGTALAANEVCLTIPLTKAGTLYTLTVKGLENSDSVAMDAAGITFKFAGKGAAAAGLPVLSGAIATDNQTIKIFFDRDVTDTSIKGQIWGVAANKMVAGAIKYIDKDADVAAHYVDLASGTEYAYQDPSNVNVLIVRISTAGEFATVNKNAALGALELVGDAAKFATSSNTALFAPSDTAVAGFTIDGVSSIDNKTIRVYFSQPVVITASTFAKIGTTDLYGDATTNITLSNAHAVDSTNTIFDFKVTVPGGLALTASSYYLDVDPAVTKATISDTTGMLTLVDEDTTSATKYQSRQFAGSGTAPTNISDIAVQMTNAKTMVIYYPEAMMATGGGGKDVTNKANYTIQDSTSPVPVVKLAQVNIVGTPVWDATNNTVTLTFDQAITTSTNGYFVQFAQTLANVLDTKVVDNSGAVIKQFAISTTTAAQVQIASAAYSAGTLTITLNQSTTAGVPAIGDLAITVNDGTAITGATIAYDAATGVITVTGIAPAIVAGQIGTVALTTTGAANLTGINGEKGAVTAAISFVQ